MLKDLKICMASGGHQMSYLMNVKHFAARKSVAFSLDSFKTLCLSRNLPYHFPAALHLSSAVPKYELHVFLSIPLHTYDTATSSNEMSPCSPLLTTPSKRS